MKKVVNYIFFLICAGMFFMFAGYVSAADKVVVVPLKSSSISKQRTYMIHKNALRVTGATSSYISYINGCAVNSSPGEVGFVPLTLPLGAKIVSVWVGVYDNSSNETYTVRLKRNYLSGGTLWGDSVFYVTGGSGTGPGVVKKNLTPKITEIVDEDEFFQLEFTSNSGTANGFCFAEITVELP